MVSNLSHYLFSFPLEDAVLPFLYVFIFSTRRIQYSLYFFKVIHLFQVFNLGGIILNPEENQTAPVSETTPEPVATPVEVQPEVSVEEPVVEETAKPEEPKEDLSAVADQGEEKEDAPVSFNWKKPIIWMVVIGVVALGIWLVANTI